MLRFRQSFLVPFVFFLISILLPVSTSADDTIPVVETYASTQQDDDAFSKYNLTNGSGTDGEVHGTEVFTMWKSIVFEPPGSYLKDWLRFDFGKMFRVNTIEIWQYNNRETEGELDVGARDIIIEGSINGFAKIDITTAILKRADQVEGGDDGYISVQKIDVSDKNIDTWLIQLIIESNYGGDQNGLSEIRFTGVESADSDGDGMADVWETYYKLDPNNFDKDLDSDDDGVKNIDEYVNHTNPTNNPPAKPTLDSPENGATGISLTPDLVPDPFFDKDGDLHLFTDWQLSEDEDFPDTNMVYSFQAGSWNQELIVNTGKLKGETWYFWRVRYYDEKQEKSPWSDVYSFKTAPADDPINNHSTGGGGDSGGGGGGGGCFMGSLR